MRKDLVVSYFFSFSTGVGGVLLKVDSPVGGFFNVFYPAEGLLGRTTKAPRPLPGPMTSRGLEQSSGPASTRY